MTKKQIRKVLSRRISYIKKEIRYIKCMDYDYATYLGIKTKEEALKEFYKYLKELKEEKRKISIIL